MIDVKKLITGFLVLATIAVCSGLTLSLIAGNSSSKTANVPTGPSIADSGSSPVPTTAFVDTGSLQGNAAELLSYVDTTSTDAVANDPNNLTNVLAASFVNGLDAANPNGITSNPDGTLNIATPDTQAIAQSISSDPAIQNIALPNWDTEAQSQLIKTTPSASQSAISQYGNSLGSVLINISYQAVCKMKWGIQTTPTHPIFLTFPHNSRVRSPTHLPSPLPLRLPHSKKVSCG